MAEDMSSDSDEVLRRLGEGDRSALEELFASNRDRLRRILQFRLPPILQRRIDVDDLLQDTFLAAERRIENYDSDYSGFVWLRMIALQTLADAYRHHVDAQMRGAGREVSAIYSPADSAELSRIFVASTTSPSLALERADLRARIAAVLDDMEAEDRELLVLRHFEEASNREAAEVMKLSPRVAAQRYERALRRLAAELRAKGSLDPKLGG